MWNRRTTRFRMSSTRYSTLSVPFLFCLFFGCAERRPIATNRTRHSREDTDRFTQQSVFIYIGTMIPWSSYSDLSIPLEPWRLVVLAIFILSLKRLPWVVLLHHSIPALEDRPQAIFAGWSVDLPLRSCFFLPLSIHRIHIPAVVARLSVFPVRNMLVADMSLVAGLDRLEFQPFIMRWLHSRNYRRVAPISGRRFSPSYCLSFLLLLSLMYVLRSPLHAYSLSSPSTTCDVRRADPSCAVHRELVFQSPNSVRKSSLKQCRQSIERPRKRIKLSGDYGAKRSRPPTSLDRFCRKVSISVRSVSSRRTKWLPRMRSEAVEVRGMEGWTWGIWTSRALLFRRAKREMRTADYTRRAIRHSCDSRCSMLRRASLPSTEPTTRTIPRFLLYALLAPQALIDRSIYSHD